MISKVIARCFRKDITFSFSVIPLKGSAEEVQSSNVRLRGYHIKAKVQDAPNLIFFPELLDPVENWLPFFNNSQYQILQRRNVYILNPRNVGNSDRNQNATYPEMANDVIRFMWQHKISTATLAGHGLGAKLALATACFHSERVTGVIGLDSSPMDQTYIQPYQQFVGYLNHLRDINLNRNFGSISSDLRKIVKCPKWRQIFEAQLIKSPTGFAWNFNLQSLYTNISKKNSSESLLNWTSHIGLWMGRTMFAFPEYSRYVHLATNTIPMYKVCPHLEGLGTDIFSIQGDENPLNHWFYEYEDQSKAFANQIMKFIRLYDGAHTLLKNRLEIGNYYIPDRQKGRINGDYIYSDYKPEHLHHNWRYSNVYDKK